MAEEACTQQGRAHIRRLHPDWTARPALMSRAAHAVESKAVVRIEVAVRSRPCLGCAVELVLRVASPPRRPTPVVRSVGGVGAHPPVPFGLSSPPAAAAAGAALGVFLLRRGVIYSKGAREPQSTTPEGRGGGGAPPPVYF